MINTPMIEPTVLLTILLMACVTYLTRLGGYPALYLATAAVTIGGSLLVLKVRSVA